MASKFANDLTLILDGGINNSQTTLDVVDATGTPTGGTFYLAVGPDGGPYELMSGTYPGTGVTLTVARHIEGSGATSHADGERVRLVVTAGVLAVFEAAKLPAGGATGQIPVKTSNADYAIGWTAAIPTGPTGPTGPTATHVVAEIDGSPSGAFTTLKVPLDALRSPGGGVFTLDFLHSLYGTEVIPEGAIPVGAAPTNRALTPSATATASSIATGSAGDVIDGNDGSAAVTSAPVTNQWFRIDLLTAKTIAAFRVIQNDDGPHTATEVLLEYSTDNVAWTGLVDTGVDAPDSGYVELDDGPVLARYWRLTAEDGGASGWDVRTIQLVAPGFFGLLGKADQGAALQIDRDLNVSYSDAHLPRAVTAFHDEARPTVGGDIVVTIDAAQRHGFWAAQDTPADGDTFQHEIVLNSGYYDIVVVGQTDADCGKIDWKLDGDGPFASGQDWYSASPTPEVTQVAATHSYNYIRGRRMLTGTVNGKNGSSSGFKIPLTKIFFRPA